ncbi:MAG TPA: methyltransferase domain-containing protein [Ktedonobacteraceae bacterium]
MPTDSPREENAYVLDADSGAETARLVDLDRLVSRNMEGLYPDDLDLASIHTILDIACGPGEWVCNVAFEHPEIDVTGIDISQSSIQYARARAQVQRLDNVSFWTMDATRPLDFPDNSFDFVNARFLVGFMSPTDWPGLLQECTRILRPGGVLRLTEAEGWGVNSSPALETLHEIGVRAMRLAGRSFFQAGPSVGIVPMLGSFLRDAGYQNIKKRAYLIDWSAGMEDYRGWTENVKVAAYLLRTFVIKMGLITAEEFEKLYQQALEEMASDDFRATLFFASAWGTR